MPDPAAARYRRLPGRPPVLRRIFYKSSTLWLGDDHLLERESTYGSERYRRFAYGDIQTLLLRETTRGLIFNVVLGVLAAGCGLLAWFTSREEAAVREWLAGIGAFWLALFVVNTLRGKTCRCQLQTAAGPHALPSLSRVRPARRAWALLAEKVDAAQGALPVEDAAREGR